MSKEEIFRQKMFTGTLVEFFQKCSDPTFIQLINQVGFANLNLLYFVNQDLQKIVHARWLKIHHLYNRPFWSLFANSILQEMDATFLIDLYCAYNVQPKLEKSLSISFPDVNIKYAWLAGPTHFLKYKFNELMLAKEKGWVPWTMSDLIYYVGLTMLSWIIVLIIFPSFAESITNRRN